MEQRGTLQTNGTYHTSDFGALLRYQQRKGQGPQLVSFQARAESRQSGRFTTLLNATGKSSVLRREEVEVSDSALYLCAVPDSPVQGACLAVQEGRGGRGCVCARLSLGEGALSSAPPALLPLCTTRWAGQDPLPGEDTVRGPEMMTLRVEQSLLGSRTPGA